MTDKKLSAIEIHTDLSGADGISIAPDGVYYSSGEKKGNISFYSYSDKKSNLLTDENTSFNYISALTNFGDNLLVAEYYTGDIYLFHPKTKQKALCSSGLSYPSYMLVKDTYLYVSEFGEGRVTRINLINFEKNVIQDGLSAPAGLAFVNDDLYIVEYLLGKVFKKTINGIEKGFDDHLFSRPWSIDTTNAKDSIYLVSERGGNKITKLKSQKYTISLERKIQTKDSIIINNKKEPRYETVKYDSIAYRWVAEDATNGNLFDPGNLSAFNSERKSYFLVEPQKNTLAELVYNFPPEGLLNISGLPKIKKTLLSDGSQITDKDGISSPLEYSWEISTDNQETWTPIENSEIAIKNKFNIKDQNFIGKYVRAKVTYTDNGGFKEKIYSKGLLIVDAIVPKIDLAISPNSFAKANDKLNLTASILELDPDTDVDKINFYLDGTLIKTVKNSPYKIEFTVPDEDLIAEKELKAEIIDKNNKSSSDIEMLYVNISEGEYHRLIGLNDINLEVNEGILFFPNPVENRITIYNRSNNEYNVTLTDFTGKKVITIKNLKNKINLVDLSSLQTGSYIISFSFENGRTVSKKLLKL